MNKKNLFILTSLFILSLFTRFYNLSSPPKVVFDETHFALYARKYFLREYYFDIHPPFGKLFLASILLLSPPRKDFDFQIGIEYPEKNYLLLRGGVALLGSIIPILVYFVTKTLGFSLKTALLASVFTILENAILVQSRFVLLDVILIFFGLCTIYFSLKEKQFPYFSRKWVVFNFLTGLSLGFTVSTKLTGFGILLLVWLGNFFEVTNKKNLKNALLKWKILFQLVLPIVIYISIFFLHFSLLPRPCEKNCGAILNPYFEECKRGINSTWTCALFIPPHKNLMLLFLKTQLLVINTNLSGEHHYFASPWFSFPLMIRPILYFKEKIDQNTIKIIAFLGNPLLWWGGFLSIISYLYLAIRIFLSKKVKEKNFDRFYFLIAGFIIQWLPFAFVPRFILLYHYLLPLLFSIIILAGFLVEVIQLPDKILLILSLGIFLVFLFFLPLNYGFPLPFDKLKFYQILPTWEF